MWRGLRLLQITLCLALVPLAVSSSARVTAEAGSRQGEPLTGRIQPAWIRLTCTFAAQEVAVVYTRSKVRFEHGPAIPVVSTRFEGDHFLFEARSSAYSVSGSVGPTSSVTLAEVGSAPQVLPCHKASYGKKPPP